MKNKILLLFLFFAIFNSQNSIAQQDSRNGKSLPCNGTLRVLIIFVEYDYDIRDTLDPTNAKTGSVKWPKGQLPVWKDSVFDPYETGDSKGLLTQFYGESSFNNFRVLGDYYPKLITIKESEVKSLDDYGFNIKTVIEKVSANGTFKSNSGLKAEDFDNWTMTQQGGPKTTPSIDSPHKWDHVMLLYRNARNLPNSNGRAVPGTFGKLCGYDCDTYSNFGTVGDLPFGICRHEFTHLFLGDNNFHAGGGERNGQGSYWIGVQCMWSVIGAAHASLACCNAWDRNRFGWKPGDKKMYISCHDGNGKEVNSDLVVAPDSTSNVSANGIYILRDFVPTGDALKIKLPYLTDNEYPQFLWIENHQTSKRNKTVFDHFVFENEACVEKSTPGLYMYMQIDRNAITGTNIYNGSADYLHPLPAQGLYDLVFDTIKQQNACVNYIDVYPFQRLPHMQNPLTGNHSIEIPTRDFNKNGTLEYGELSILSIERKNDEFIKHLAYLGNASVAFTKTYNSKIGIGTNPSTTNLLSNVSNAYPTKMSLNNKNAVFNNRISYLNGLSVELLEELPDGSIKVKVRTDDFVIKNDVRWCSDTIVIPAACSTEKNYLHVTNNAVVIVDQGLTPTRISKPVEFEGEKIFSSTSTLKFPENTVVIIESGSKLIADNSSAILLTKGSKLIIESGGELIVKNNSKLILQGATLDLKKGSKATVKGKENLIRDEGSRIIGSTKGMIKK